MHPLIILLQCYRNTGTFTRYTNVHPTRSDQRLIVKGLPGTSFDTPKVKITHLLFYREVPDSGSFKTVDRITTSVTHGPVLYTQEPDRDLTGTLEITESKRLTFHPVY